MGFDVLKEKDPNGRWICKALFYEWHLPVNTTDPVFTIQDYDRTIDSKLYPSLYRLYMEAEDVTEFDFANEHLGCHAHWEALCKTALFQPEVERWRKELELKIQARALKLLALEADSGSKNAFSANKYLADKGWIKTPPGKRGRPSKDEIKKEADLDISKIMEDYERLELNKQEIN